MYLLDLSLGSIPFKIVPFCSDTLIPVPLPLLERVLEVLFLKHTKLKIQPLLFYETTCRSLKCSAYWLKYSRYSDWVWAGRSGDRILVGGEIFRICPDWPWGPPSLLYNAYRVFSRGKEQPRHDADPSPPSCAMVKRG
jgi:hypothetical protein